MAKFCHLEASPQNNEVGGLDWMGQVMVEGGGQRHDA